jgi:hypothetical protein
VVVQQDNDSPITAAPKNLGWNFLESASGSLSKSLLYAGMSLQAARETARTQMATEWTFGKFKLIFLELSKSGTVTRQRFSYYSGTKKLVLELLESASGCRKHLQYKPPKQINRY